jgi:hypothetical protein
MREYRELKPSSEASGKAARQLLGPTGYNFSMTKNTNSKKRSAERVVSRMGAGLTATVVALGLALSCTGTAQALDLSEKPGGMPMQDALMALDRIEDAEILGRPKPTHDPALGARAARVNFSVPGYDPEDRNARVGGPVPFTVSVSGFSRGPLTVWALVGGAMCVDGSKSKWRKWTIRNGDTIKVPVADKSFTTSVFFRVSDSQGTFRWAESLVRVASKAYLKSQAEMEDW